jgi:hypothetical protein
MREMIKYRGYSFSTVLALKNLDIYLTKGDCDMGI